MNNKGFVGVLILLIFLAIAAFLAYAWIYSKDYKIPNPFAKNETVCEKTVCPNFPELDKVAYYFDNDTYLAMRHFLDNTGQRVWCSFTALEDESLAKEFVALKRQGKDVKVHFGRDDTMTDCEIVCVPKLESQYNYLLGEGIDVSFSRINFNFCVNEKAVYVFSKLPQNTAKQDFGLIIFSPELRSKYDAYFKQISE